MKPTPEYGLNTIEMLNTTALCGAAYISSINNPPQLLKQYMWGKTKAKWERAKCFSTISLVTMIAEKHQQNNDSMTAPTMVRVFNEEGEQKTRQLNSPQLQCGINITNDALAAVSALGGLAREGAGNGGAPYGWGRMLRILRIVTATTGDFRATTGAGGGGRGGGSAWWSLRVNERRRCWRWLRSVAAVRRGGRRGLWLQWWWCWRMMFFVWLWCMMCAWICGALPSFYGAWSTLTEFSSATEFSQL